jgi:hypothetical protein
MIRYAAAVIAIAAAAIVSPVFAQKAPEGEVKRLTAATTVMD